MRNCLGWLESFCIVAAFTSPSSCGTSLKPRRPTSCLSSHSSLCSSYFCRRRPFRLHPPRAAGVSHRLLQARDQHPAEHLQELQPHPTTAGPCAALPQADALSPNRRVEEAALSKEDHRPVQAVPALPLLQRAERRRQEGSRRKHTEDHPWYSHI